MIETMRGIRTRQRFTGCFMAILLIAAFGLTANLSSQATAARGALSSPLASGASYALPDDKAIGDARRSLAAIPKNLRIGGATRACTGGAAPISRGYRHRYCRAGVCTQQCGPLSGAGPPRAGIARVQRGHEGSGASDAACTRAVGRSLSSGTCALFLR